MIKNVLCWSSLFLLPLWLVGQEAILLNNPSFEDVPKVSKVPVGWQDCGEEGESPADTHPSGAFGVVSPPHEGRSYLGMVVRENRTWESVGQALPVPFSPGTCYAFSIHAARSPLFESLSRLTNEVASYTGAVRLRVWAGYYPCEREELLWQTVPIPFVDWTRLDMVLKPSAPYTYLILEAFYDGDALLPYNGNLLLDNASPLLPVDCGNPRTANLKLDVLEAPPLASAEALQAFLIEQAGLVKFDAASGQLSRHLFRSESGEMMMTNRNLWLIGRAVAQFPKLKLEVFLPKQLNPTDNLHDLVFYHQPELMKLYRQGAVEALEAAGLEAYRYKITIGASPQLQRKAPWLLPARDLQFNLRLRGKAN